ncbi:hypothetical protein [Streptomyces zagrosensis]|uniref:Uncharacterized protein n=1 Tax=Streptomyces zagrosensis TaxID=1042984 RepID=A0A7W9Q3V4_9ACTN|nr:hypothetical protein [Streptomyces zagrosensis]MBB5933110.1 hypothetical protein [Streptomyces zagrosensis]
MTAEAESTSAVVPRSSQKEKPPNEEGNKPEGENEEGPDEAPEGDDGGSNEELRPAA